MEADVCVPCAFSVVCVRILAEQSGACRAECQFGAQVSRLAPELYSTQATQEAQDANVQPYADAARRCDSGNTFRIWRTA